MSADLLSLSLADACLADVFHSRPGSTIIVMHDIRQADEEEEGARGASGGAHDRAARDVARVCVGLALGP